MTGHDQIQHKFKLDWLTFFQIFLRFIFFIKNYTYCTNFVKKEWKTKKITLQGSNLTSSLTGLITRPLIVQMAWKFVFLPFKNIGSIFNCKISNFKHHTEYLLITVVKVLYLIWNYSTNLDSVIVFWSSYPRFINKWIVWQNPQCLRCKRGIRIARRHWQKWEST